MFKCLRRGLKVFVLGLYMVQFELKVVGRSGFLGFPDPGNVPWTSGKLFSLSLSRFGYRGWCSTLEGCPREAAKECDNRGRGSEPSQGWSY